MTRIFCLGAILSLAVGCQLPPERPTLKPLPDDSPPLPYATLATRARGEASAATEAFYVNNWANLEDAARALEQTANFLARATEVPARHRDTVAAESASLLKEARALRAAAMAHEVKPANDTLQRLNLQVRELRLEN